MDNTLYWITHPSPTEKDQFYIFQKEFTCSEGTVPSEDAQFTARVSADTRYKLYLNGKLVSVGPCKGTDATTYYETVDLTPCLRPGKNRITARVLHLDNYIAKAPGPLLSLIRRNHPAFLFDGRLTDSGTETPILSDESWEVRIDARTTLGPPVLSSYASFNESTVCSRTAEFRPAAILEPCHIDTNCANEYGELDTYVLQPRPILPLTAGSQEVLASDIEVGANNDKTIVLDAGQHVTAYLTAAIQGGKGAHLELLYSECFVQPDGDAFTKGDRSAQDGILPGDYDTLDLAGGSFVYEPFWFKTYRFIQIRIKTAAEPLRLESLAMWETHYPIEKQEFSCSDESYNRMWDVSFQTLKNCMHETFEDCPYYEQLQYIMDTRLQMLFAYQLSADYSMQKKAITDFAESRLPSGLLQSRYPCMKHQVIPGFSLHYILMLEDYLRYTGDRKLVKDQLSVVDAILNWFDNHLNKEHLVGPTGFWPYVDWVDGWAFGVPNGEREKPLTVYSMMYSAALRSAATIVKQFGREELSGEYLDRRFVVNDSLRHHCFRPDTGMYTDIPGEESYSQHPQIWAILCGAARKEERKPLLLRALEPGVKPCSFAMCFYTLRALEKADMYEYSDQIYEVWRDMLSKNCTTWPEKPGNPRSECHAWSAVMLYEFPTMILGVRPGQKEKELLIQPYTETLTHAKGTVATRYGAVSVEWNKEQDGFFLSVKGPEGITLSITLPDGMTKEVHSGSFTYKSV